MELLSQIVAPSELWYNDLGWWIALFASIIVTIIVSQIYFRRNRKKISCQVKSDDPLVNATSEAKSAIKIMDRRNNVELEDVNLVNISVSNTGVDDIIIWNRHDKDIKDEEKPITFRFEGRTVISLTELKVSSQSNVILSDEQRKSYLDKLSSSQYTDTLSLPHCRIKSRGSIALSVLVSGPKGVIIQEGDISNGKITKLDRPNDPNIIAIDISPRSSLALATYFLIWWGLAYLSMISPEPLKAILSIIAIIILALLPAIGLVWMVVDLISDSIKFIRDLVRGKKIRFFK